MSAHTTAAPARAKVRAVARPMPLALPTTIATFPVIAASGMGTSVRLEVWHDLAGEQLERAVRLLVGEVAEDEAADEVVDAALGDVALELGADGRRRAHDGGVDGEGAVERVGEADGGRAELAPEVADAVVPDLV